MTSVGDPAPDFEGECPGGRRFRLSALRGRRNVVIFFYPRDGTPVCTAEACGFRDAYGALCARDTEVVGVSMDDTSAHARFARQHDLPFPIVADPDGAIGSAFGAVGAIRRLLGLAERVTFVIDKAGIVRAVVRGEMHAARHVEEARRAVEALQAGG